MNTTTNNKQKSEMNQDCVLIQIAKFGWLTTSHIARLCFADAKNLHSATTIAQKTIRRLLDKKLISKKENRGGINCFVLTRTGADRANYIFENRGEACIAGHGFDLSALNVEQKERIVEAAVNFKKNGFEAVPRHELKRRDENQYNIDAVFFKNSNSGVYTICATIVHNSNRSTIDRINSLMPQYNKILILGDAVFTAAILKKIKSKRVIELRSTADHD